ncbi:MAG: 50S ribosomal protein L6 [Clostridia bacterium]|nr:50S ribosomal protein L6 [Clostridia bacterium]MDE7306605.1 50S ribosomal protein L6 [Clostridia bacterium]
MSRIGKLPVAIPAGVTVTFENGLVTVKGAKGTLTQQITGDIDIKIEGAEAHVVKTGEGADANAKHGLYRALLHNMVVGVTEGYKKSLKVNGVGWKVAKQGNKLVMNVGFSHPVDFAEPAGVKLECPSPNEIVVSGIDKTLVGQVAADIRKIRIPEPYHGYGIAYSDEVIERKEGKTGGKGKK